MPGKPDRSLEADALPRPSSAIEWADLVDERLAHLEKTVEDLAARITILESLERDAGRQLRLT